MNVVYLLLGSNLSDRKALLNRAREGIVHNIGKITDISSIYESQPWGFKTDQMFLNQVIRTETELSPGHVLEAVLSIEGKLGRKRDPLTKEYSSRTIDIDILFYNDEIVSQQNLTIPHPKIAERLFTLLPLYELDRSLVHPGSRKTIGEMLNECPDQLDVYIYNS